jgi:hypothetical protein
MKGIDIHRHRKSQNRILTVPYINFKTNESETQLLNNPFKENGARMKLSNKKNVSREALGYIHLRMRQMKLWQEE